MIGYHFILESTYQGQIMEKVNENYYLCDFFSWISGEHTFSKLMSIDEFKKCVLFKDVEMQNEYVKKNNYFPREKENDKE